MSIWNSILEGISTTPWQLAAALILDLIFGDPRWLPHPAKWTGVLVAPLERLLVKSFGKTVFGGAIFWIVICLGQGVLLLGLAACLPPIAWWILETWLIYQCFAAMDMHRHVKAILLPLREGNLVKARERLSWIVGRETAQLSEAEVCRATVESVGESACDALIAPLFWSALFGPVGALVYRATNTLDSMVGHRDERFEKFGKVSARMDDVLNWIPARLVALLSAPEKMMIFYREARGHRSPNAGWGESAIAWATGVKLGGINFYEGEALKGPSFNEKGREPDPDSIQRSIQWWWRVVFTGFPGMIGLCWLL